MASGSGKTGAFVIPLVEKLRSHSAKVGSRALILSPSRELALQTLMVVKELGRGTDLKCVLLVGGDSLEEQFGFMVSASWPFSHNSWHIMSSVARSMQI